MRAESKTGIPPGGQKIMGKIINSQEYSAGHHEDGDAVTGAREKYSLVVAPGPHSSPNTSVTEHASTPRAGDTQSRDSSESSLFLPWSSPSDFPERQRRHDSVLSDDSGFESAPLETPPEDWNAILHQARLPPSVQDDRPEDDLNEAMRQARARERINKSDESS